MKTAVIFYTYTGKTKEVAAKKARKEKADLIEIKERSRRSTVGAYVLGSLAAMGRRKAEIAPPTCDFSAYERFLVAVPLWAGYPAPVFNNILELLPKGKTIELIITSGSGDSSRSKEKTLAYAASKGIKITKYLDTKTSGT